MKKKLLTILLVASMTCGAALLSAANLTAFAENALDEAELTANSAESVADPPTLMSAETAEEMTAPTEIAAVELQAKRLIDSGSCGENLTYALYDDGELVISGIGEM